ncbi:MAG: leucine-rich repeat protein [Bacteroidaceae bacterium]|nr:leucine-rich repeat protein [Bacteroidaceae bacterium]
MKTSKLLLTVLAFCIAVAALADDIKIPTTDKNPFDLKMGTVTSEDTHEHFTSNGLEWMRDGDNITFTLQNEQEVDYYFVTVNADTGNDGVTIDLSLKTEKGDAVADTTFGIQRKGWYQTTPYLTKTKAMKKGRYTLTLTFHSTPGNTTGNVKSISFQSPEPIAIPTDDDHPFDLTKAFVLSNSTNQHFTDYGVEYMYNDNQLIYNLQCSEDMEVCNVYVGSDTQYSEVSLDLNLTNLNGETVADTTFQIENNGWYKPVIYSLQLRTLKKGRYTLTFTFHQSHHTNWSACNISSIAFKKPQNLKPGDDLDIVNPEFDDGLNGWTRENGLGSGTYSLFDNNISLIHFNYGKGSLSQTIYNLPDGLYLLRLNAYDSTPGWNGTDPMEQDFYVFLNDRMVPMKTAYDDAVGYRNIYRLQDDVTNTTNNDYRRRTDGRWVPTHQREWNEALAMKERLYENCVVVAITNGQATLGWKKTVDRGTRIPCDHARLTYLAKSTDLKAYANSINATIINNEDVSAAIERTILTNDLKERLSTLEQAIRTELAAKRSHAPQAIAEANAIINAELAYHTDVEFIDAILHAEHLMQRLQLPFYDLTLSSSATLASLIETLGIQTTDSISLKLSGIPSSDDLATLKTLTKLTELDLSETTLTTLPEQQFADMKFLTWVTLPDKLEAIGNRAFDSCWRLRDMELPTTLRSIDYSTFWACYSLDHAIIPEGVTVGTSAYSRSGVKTVVLPTSLKEVPYNIFSNCYDLADIQFSKQEIIGQDAFCSCTSLTTITLPEGMKRMNSNCFGSCSGLTSATLPSTLVLVSSPFGNCKNLQELTCLTIAPPYPSGSSIAGDYWGNVETTLYVPNLSVASYQEADKWNQFNIVGIDTLPNYYSIISDLTLDMTEALPADYKPDLTFSGLYAYWGGDVTSIPTRGTLTVEGSTMLSTKRFTQYYTPFAQRSMANRGDWGPGYTSLINNGQLRADTVTIDLCLYTNCWEFLSFPFDVRVSDIRYRFANVPLIIYGYDAQKRAEGKHSETWVEMTADSILHAGKGYIWQTTIPQNQVEWRSETYGGAFNYHYNIFDIDAMQNANKPLFFRSDDVEVTLEKYTSEYAHDRSWNFIGNPYPCYFDIHCIETTAPLIVWTFTSSYNGRYQAYSPLDDDLILFPGQAFFMQCPLEQDKVVFLKEGRQHNLEVHYDTAESPIRARAMAKMPQREVFNLVLKGERSEESDSSEKLETLDRTRFVINPTAALDYEPGRDASKFFSLNAGTAHLYTHENGVRYAIDERPLADGTVQLGLQLPTSGTYTLQLDTKAEETVTLIDQTTGKETRMDGNSEGYTFYANTGTCDNRFVLYLGDAATGITEVATPLQQGEQQFYDLQGRPVSHPQKGIYIQNNKKVIIK